jgi:hypothetical protein
MAERLQDSDFQRFFLIRVRLLYWQEAQYSNGGIGVVYAIILFNIIYIMRS